MQIVFGSCSRVTDAQPAAQFDSYYKTRLNNDDTSEWPQDEAREVNIATWCSRQDLKPVTIRQVLLRAAQRHPGPFRVLLRLAGYNPRDLKQWCKKLPGQQAGDGPATESSGGGSQQQQENWAWAAQLLLEDATGEGQLTGWKGAACAAWFVQLVCRGCAVGSIISLAYAHRMCTETLVA